MAMYVGSALVFGAAGVAVSIVYNCGRSDVSSNSEDHLATPVAERVDRGALHAAGIDLDARRVTVLVYFRGTWSPPCRTQLRQLSQAVSDFEQGGVAIHAITSEPGGNEALYSRLRERSVLDHSPGETSDPTLVLPVHSDPDLTLCAEPREQLHVFEDLPADETPSGIGSYTCVQPAMVVVDRQGRVQQWWSWRRITDDPNPSPMKLVPSPKGAIPLPLTAIRPKTEDILPSIREYRQVETTSLSR
mmetsp:Transcript_25074/g.70033  ORF Transcript_25074/g.70033 Transcript_25074/m.70033 type:complete len:246 (-) Transcript_25074:244-981(-)|eukprot:CAMPEP_0117655538 /NCGR_PEP_ID=MMETSP0804-20121206/4331_1 /TAXON_ID=1074897 /ORGANISM="Tetraselmis astigmatica, Strain CCMP880" /LENGTH=245 /DNA_ID=CAMNT_0005461893 /DNA_START=138 /DNA_END=875 /DNA_ORIENTATION=+